uniref:Uncharacterized protein n=1 Tax=Solibacter usitatus (strain Ellin6076) TaxID=234267 RepID=Q021B8_SOLUE
MGDTEYLLEPAELESIVLGAADKAAESLGLRIAAPAKDFCYGNLCRRSIRQTRRAASKNAGRKSKRTLPPSSTLS